MMTSAEGPAWSGGLRRQPFNRDLGNGPEREPHENGQRLGVLESVSITHWAVSGAGKPRVAEELTGGIAPGCRDEPG